MILKRNLLPPRRNSDKAAAEAEEEMKAVEAAASGDAGQPMVSVSVVVNEKKPNGKAWDALGGKPDLALCYEVAGTKTCIPGRGSPP